MLGPVRRRQCTDSIGGSSPYFAHQALTNSLRCIGGVELRAASCRSTDAMPSQRPLLSREEAEAVGLSALVFLTEDGHRLTRFLSETGINPAELRGAAGEPATLAAVLDHLLADESLLMVFAAEAGIDVATIGPARAALDTRDAPARATGRRGKPSKRWPGI